MSEMQNKLYDTANEMPLIDIRDGMFSREDGFGGYDVRSVHEFLTRINKLVASDKNEAALELMDDYMDNIITVKDGGAYKNGEVCGFMDNIRYGLKVRLSPNVQVSSGEIPNCCWINSTAVLFSPSVIL